MEWAGVWRLEDNRRENHPPKAAGPHEQGPEGAGGDAQAVVKEKILEIGLAQHNRHELPARGEPQFLQDGSPAERQNQQPRHEEAAASEDELFAVSIDLQRRKTVFDDGERATPEQGAGHDLNIETER